MQTLLYGSEVWCLIENMAELSARTTEIHGESNVLSRAPRQEKGGWSCLDNGVRGCRSRDDKEAE